MIISTKFSSEICQRVFEFVDFFKIINSKDFRSHFRNIIDSIVFGCARFTDVKVFFVIRSTFRFQSIEIVFYSVDWVTNKNRLIKNFKNFFSTIQEYQQSKYHLNYLALNQFIDSVISSSTEVISSRISKTIKRFRSTINFNESVDKLILTFIEQAEQSIIDLINRLLIFQQYRSVFLNSFDNEFIVASIDSSDSEFVVKRSSQSIEFNI